MNFRISGYQRELRDLIRKFCTREVKIEELLHIITMHAQCSSLEDIRKTFPYDLLEKLHEIGIRQLAVPQIYGGTAPTTHVNVTLTMAAEELGYWGGPIVGLVMIPWIFLRAIAVNHTISPDQKEWIFSRFLRNPSFMIAASVSEGDSATDIHLPFEEGMGQVLKTKAHFNGNSWIIDGTKAYCSGGGVANYIMIATRTEENLPVSKACTFFWVPADHPGVYLKPHKMAVSDFGGNCQVVLNEVRIPSENMLGKKNEGFSIIKSFFNAHLPGIAGFVGIMRRIYEHMRHYAKQRIAGGKPIIEHSGIKSKLGEIAAEIEACRALMYRAAWEIDQVHDKGAPDENLYWFGVTYGYCKKIFPKFCEIASAVYGGMSLSLDYPLANFLIQSFYIQAAGLTREVDFFIACRDYDKRYSEGF